MGGLLTGYYGQEGYTGPNNRENVELPKEVKLFLDAVSDPGGGLLIYYSVTATERFRFVGMTETAAATCQAAMVTLYTENINGVQQCVADVSATRQAGRMWQVEVSVMRVTVEVEAVSPPE